MRLPLLHKCSAMLGIAGQHLTLCTNMLYSITHFQQPCLGRALLIAERFILSFMISAGRSGPP